MYKSMGFRDCKPHHDYPSALMPYLVFMELPLEEGPAQEPSTIGSTV